MIKKKKITTKLFNNGIPYIISDTYLFQPPKSKKILFFNKIFKEIIPQINLKLTCSHKRIYNHTTTK